MSLTLCPRCDELVPADRRTCPFCHGNRSRPDPSILAGMGLVLASAGTQACVSMYGIVCTDSCVPPGTSAFDSEFRVTGEVDGVTGTVPGLEAVQVGDVVSGSLPWTGGIEDRDPDPSAGRFPNELEWLTMWLEVGAASLDGTAGQVLLTENGLPDRILWNEGGSVGGVVETDGVLQPDLVVALTLTDAAGLALTSDVPPHAGLELSVWTEVSLVLANGADSVSIRVDEMEHY